MAEIDSEANSAFHASDDDDEEMASGLLTVKDPEDVEDRNKAKDDEESA